MIRIVLYAVAAVLGILYAIFPKRVLGWKSPDREVSETQIKTARVFGVIVALLAVVLAVLAVIRQA